jgi:hypothetical protein
VTSKNYIIYDQEPVKILLDLPAFICGFILPLFLVWIIPKDAMKSPLVIIAWVICYVGFILTLTSLWSKYVTSNKLNIELNSEYLEISCRQKRVVKDKTRIYLSEIEKIEVVSAQMGRFRHFKIYYSNGRILAISKFTLYYLIRDDLEKFMTDLKREIKIKSSG